MTGTLLVLFQVVDGFALHIFSISHVTQKRLLCYPFVAGKSPGFIDQALKPAMREYRYLVEVPEHIPGY
jgi:hypothetical protein